MRRSLIFSLILIAAVATPVMADVEPIGVIRPPTKPPRSVDFSGDHAVFGFYQANSTVEGDGAGLVKIYTADGSEWGLAANIQPDGLGERMWFGHDVAIQARTLVVGAPGDRWQDDRVGKVRVYDGWGDTWTVVDTLVSPDSAAADRYGVSLSLDGDLLAVGAIGANATYVYERAFGVWGITGSLEPSGEETDFGRTVEVSGSTIAIGSDQAVHVFVNSPAGWESQERIPTPGERWSDLNLDGDTLVFNDDAGAIRVYERSGSVWSYAQKITKPSDAGPHSDFPEDIALRGDGLVIGDDSRNSDPQSVINVYRRLGGMWLRSEVIEFIKPSHMTFADGGELLVGRGPWFSEPWGTYHVYPPLGGITCHGETPTILGTPGDDVLMGTNGRDVIHGFDGNDIIEGRGGDDLLCGGIGTDTVSYESARRVKVDLSAGYAKGHHGDDVLTGFENVTGSRGKDVLIGDAGKNVLSGLGNKDLLRGMGGRDVIDGGEGIDTTSYLWATAGVSVDLVAGTSDGADGIDTLISIEAASGSNFDDTLIGDAGPNQLRGLAGNDTLEGGPGDDVLRGGWGPNDMILYGYAPAGVIADLREALVTGGDGVDRLSGVEGVDGSSFDDVLIGNGKDNTLLGGQGDDFLNGRSGDDVIDGEQGNDFHVPGPGDDVVGTEHQHYEEYDTVSYEYAAGPISANLSVGRATGQGTDHLENIVIVIGSRFGDDIHTVNDSEDNLIVPLGGNDTVTGDRGDQVTFAFSKQPVTVHLGSGTAVGEGSDRLLRLRQVVGSAFDDTLTGSSGPDALWGLAGDDILRGGDEDDYLDGMDGTDRLEGGSGLDYCRNGESHSSCEYRADAADSRSREARTLTVMILEFMEMAARYR